MTGHFVEVADVRDFDFEPTAIVVFSGRLRRTAD